MKNISLWSLFGFATTSLLGTLLHFLYEWTGESLVTAPISGVNESTWEHMKLLYFPMLAFALVQSRYNREQNFWCIKLVSIITGLILIPALFYTYNGAIGKSPDWVNIAIFFISAALAYALEYKMFKNTPVCQMKIIPLGIILFIGILFVLFTFATPQIPIFRDPITGSYGI